MLSSFNVSSMMFQAKQFPSDKTITTNTVDRNTTENHDIPNIVFIGTEDDHADRVKASPELKIDTSRGKELGVIPEESSIVNSPAIAGSDHTKGRLSTHSIASIFKNNPGESSLLPPKPASTLGRYTKNVRQNLLRSSTQAMNNDPDLEDLISNVQMMSVSNKNVTNLSNNSSHFSSCSRESSLSAKSKLAKAIKQVSMKNKIDPVNTHISSVNHNSNSISSILGDSSYIVNPEQISEGKPDNMQNNLLDKFKSQLNERHYPNVENAPERLLTKSPDPAVKEELEKPKLEYLKSHTQALNLHYLKHKYPPKPNSK